ncbi:BON1-associated protein 2-like [Heracleum sosnowskyi]|uniref:BON1-associated protein 2-like n=1 Tax=Heracleum sosnowskyi TaxID=360622 RepID=A0AAD8LY76_9APIA|nr:BON1-associated protein 2-like [Heracleum sosnowskyi]
MEITVISAQGLRSKTNLLSSRRVRPFTTLSTNINGYKHHHIYRTKVDNHGGANPTWGDKFQLPVDKVTFDYSNIVSSYIYLEVFTKRLVAGESPLGWCQIPVTDFVNELYPKDGIRQLSYQLRNRDGSRGEGVVSIEVKLTGLIHARFQRLERPLKCSGELPRQDVPGTVIGIPVTQSEGREFLSIINMPKLGVCQTQQRWYSV